MKKRFILFAALLMTLASCGTKNNNSTSGSGTSTPGSVGGTSTSDKPVSIPSVENTIYFNLGKYGLFDGKAGTDISAASLEYGVSYTAMSGTALPGADRVTSTRGVKFLYWVMPSTAGGALTKVEKMPANPGTILEAWWEEGDVNNPDIPDIPDIPDNPGDLQDLPTTGNYQYLATSADSTKGYVLEMNHSTMFNVDEYSVTANFEAGFEFKFYSTTKLFNYDSAYYPTLKSGKGDNGFTFCADVAAGLYAHDYLEVTAEPDESGINEFDEDWIKYRNADAPSLRFKKSGNYTLYIRLYDNGGWLQIYVSPNF